MIESFQALFAGMAEGAPASVPAVAQFSLAMSLKMI
jgi:hypothetical protein